MNKLLKILVFVLLTNVATAQKHQIITGYGFQWMRGIFDSSLQIPTGSGTPSGTAYLKSVVKTKSALFYDSTGKKLWVFSPKDSTWYQANGATNMPWDSITGKPSNFSTTYALSNDIQDSITARLRLIDTAGMLSPYRRSSTMIQQSEVDGLSSSLSAKLNLSDTAAMLSHYYNKTASDALLATKINSSLINANNGVAGLDAGGKVPLSLLPAALMIYKGTWNAATNTPTLSDGTGVTGWIYIVSTGGTVNTGSGNITYSAGDYAIYNGTAWERSVGTNNVASVNGQQGVVTLTTSNIGEGTNLYYTDARARAAFSAGAGISLASGVITNTAPDQTVSLTNGGNITVTGTYPNFTLTNGITNNNQLTNGAGYITGNQTISFSATGDVTGSSSGGTSLTPNLVIGAGKVTNAMLAGSIDYSKMNAATVPTWNQNTTGNAATATTATNWSGSSALGSYAYRSSGLAELSGATFTGGISGTSATFSSTGSFTNQLGVYGTGSTIFTSGAASSVRAGAYTWMGGSGGDYGSVGYNIAYTSTSGSYNYFTTDYSSILRFDAGGFSFLTAPSGTVGTPITYTERAYLGSSQFSINVPLSGTTASFSGVGQFGGDLGLGRAGLTGGGNAKWITAEGISGSTYGGGLISSINGTAKGYVYSDNGYMRIQGTAGEGIRLVTNNTTIALDIASSGAIAASSSVTATAFYESSDLRQKTVHTTLKSSDGIDAIQYTFKPTNSEKWGYGAQQVQPILPYAVSKGEDGFLKVDYTTVHTYKIAQLEKRIAELEKLVKK